MEIRPAISRLRTLPLFLMVVGVAYLALDTWCARGQTPPPPSRSTPAKIVLKLDDMTGLHPNWQKVADLIDQRGIKASFGIICNSLEQPKPEYIEWIKTVQAKGRIEFWCHGYDHKMWTENSVSMMEFSGPPREQQAQHLARCQQLAVEKLGAPFRTFGAPFNATDSTFAQIIREDPDLKVWMYGDAQFPMGKTVLVRVPDTNIENPIFHPSLEKFVQGYQKHPTVSYFVIQGHPPQWDAERLAEFGKIVDFLVQEKAVFLTPTELAAALPAPGPAGRLPPPSKPIAAPVAHPTPP